MMSSEELLSLIACFDVVVVHFLSQNYYNFMCNSFYYIKLIATHIHWSDFDKSDVA